MVLPLDRGGSGNKLPPFGEFGVDPNLPPDNLDMAEGRRRGGVAPSARNEGEEGWKALGGAGAGAEEANDTVEALARARAG